MKSILKYFCLFCLVVVLTNCNDSSSVTSSMQREVRFSLSYGAFEDQIQLFNFETVQNDIPVSCFMRDGFFYISSNVSKKIMQFNSYGDLLAVYYNEANNPAPSFAKTDTTSTQETDVFSKDETKPELGLSTRKSIPYQFYSPTTVVADKDKNIYVVEQIPFDRQTLDQEYRILLKNVILRFSTDGSFDNYIGQEGVGGTPFPLIQGIYTNENQDLIVVSRISAGYVVYWYNSEGQLKYKLPIYEKNLPNPLENDDIQRFTVIEKIIPDTKSETLFIKMDIFENFYDPSTNVASGLTLKGTYIYSFSIEKNEFVDLYKIPNFVSSAFNESDFEKPYELLGIANDKFYFSSPDETGYSIMILDRKSLSQVKRHLDVLPEENQFNSIFLTDEGLVCGFFATEYGAKILWWRTDLLFTN